MKKTLIAAVALVLIFTLAACGNNNNNNNKNADNNAKGGSKNEPKEVTLTVGASPVPHAEILNFVKDTLKKEGVNLVVKEFSDYVLPNTQLDEKQLDANFFQHTPYLEQFNKDHNMNLVSVVGVHIEPFGIYSKKLKSLDDVKKGATVAIPVDPSNAGRALALLEKAGLIKLKDGVGISGTKNDIVDNPKKLDIKELDAAMLPRSLDDVDLSLINTNYALEAKLVPTKDALLLEDKDSPYVNILVAREDNKDSDAIQKLAKALTTPEVKKFIEDKYQGSIVPAF